MVLDLQFLSEVLHSGCSARSGEVACFLVYLQLLTHPNRTLRRGKHRLLLWPDVEADGCVETTTPSKMEVQDEMGRLEKVNQLISWHQIHIFYLASEEI